MNHDCCNSSNKKITEKGGIDPFVLGVIIVTIFLLGIAIYFGTKTGATSQVTTDTQVVLSTDSKVHDWGTIDINGGIASKSFAIKNTGSSILKLYNVVTSCMCTTAQLKTSELASRKYKMHEKTQDVFEVKPGQTAELIVEFDPLFHGPSGVGPINRTITMDTNDENNPTLSFNLTANVVKK